jgi:hypothetical protein
MERENTSPVGKKGYTGNPGGRPKANRDVMELAREFGPEAISTLGRLLLESEDPKVRIEAAKVLLDRGFGKAPATMNLSTTRSLEEMIASSFK